MYIVGLPERENMAYQARVEALRTGDRHQHCAPGVGQLGEGEMAGQRAYYYVIQEKVALHAFRAAVGEELQLKCTERGCKTLEMAVEEWKFRNDTPGRRCEPCVRRNLT